MATSELFQGSREGVRDAESARFVRRFLVTGATRDNVLSEPGIPTEGSSFVFNGRNLRCDSLTVRATSNPTVHEVEAAYSTDGSGKLPKRIDDSFVGFKTTSLQFVRSEFKVPAFRLRPVKVTTLTGNPPAPTEQVQNVYEPYDFTVEHYYANLQVRLNVENFSQTDYTTIASKQGKVHAFGTAPNGSLAIARPGSGIPTGTMMLWKFIGAQADQQTDKTWTITYNWINDPGTGEFDVLNDAAGGVILAPYDNRYAFETYYVTPQNSTGTGPGNPDFPEIDSLPAFTLDGYQGTGYQTLPGVPIE